MAVDTGISTALRWRDIRSVEPFAAQLMTALDGASDVVVNTIVVRTAAQQHRVEAWVTSHVALGSRFALLHEDDLAILARSG